MVALPFLPPQAHSADPLSTPLRNFATRAIPTDMETDPRKSDWWPRLTDDERAEFELAEQQANAGALAVADASAVKRKVRERARSRHKRGPSLTLGKHSDGDHYVIALDEQAARQLLVRFDQVRADDAALAALARNYMEICIRQAGKL